MTHLEWNSLQFVNVLLHVPQCLKENCLKEKNSKGRIWVKWKPLWGLYKGFYLKCLSFCLSSSSVSERQMRSDGPSKPRRRPLQRREGSGRKSEIVGSSVHYKDEGTGSHMTGTVWVRAGNYPHMGLCSFPWVINQFLGKQAPWCRPAPKFGSESANTERWIQTTAPVPRADIVRRWRTPTIPSLAEVSVLREEVPFFD